MGKLIVRVSQKASCLPESSISSLLDVPIITFIMHNPPRIMNTSNLIVEPCNLGMFFDMYTGGPYVAYKLAASWHMHMH